jgi:hypothetical protein
MEENPAHSGTRSVRFLILQLFFLPQSSPEPFESFA